jgi:hypothetical protein
MKLLRIGPAGQEKPGALVDDEHYVDLSDEVADFDETFFAGAELERIAPIVAERAASGQRLPLHGVRIGAPIARPHQIICVGLNLRPRRRDQPGRPGRADPVHQIAEHSHRPVRRCADPAGGD